MRTRETLEKTLNFMPRMESLIQNQKILAELLLDIREMFQEYQPVFDNIRNEIIKQKARRAFDVTDMSGAHLPKETEPSKEPDLEPL